MVKAVLPLMILLLSSGCLDALELTRSRRTTPESGLEPESARGPRTAKEGTGANNAPASGAADNDTPKQAPRSRGSVAAVSPVACGNKFKSAKGRAGWVVRGQRSIRKEEQSLAYADRLYREGMQCLGSSHVRQSEKYERVRKAQERAKTQLDKARALHRSRKEALGLWAEGGKLKTMILSSSGLDISALRGRVAAYKKKVDLAKMRNVSIRYPGRSWIARMFYSLNKALEQAQKRYTALKMRGNKAHVLAGAVVDHLQGFTLQDSHNPDKVTAAFLKMKPKHFVYTIPASKRGTRYGHKFHYYRPTTKNHIGSTNYSAPSQPLKIPAIVENSTSTVYVEYTKQVKDLPSGVPGLVWAKLKSGKVVFVTIDGGRYISDPAALTNGVPKRVRWPKGLLNPVLLEKDVLFLAKLLVLPARYKKLGALGKGYQRCAKRIYKANAGRFRAIRTANILPHVRDTRLEYLRDRIKKRILRRCKSHVRRYKSLWTNAMILWLKRRRQALQKNSTRLLSVASGISAQ